MARAPMPAPVPLESPAVKRSAMLAQLLEQQREPVQITGGYGELAARLLGQGISAFAANKAERAAKEEQTEAMRQRASRLAAALGGGAPEPAAPAMPMAPPVTNTQEPQSAPIAPAAQVQGSPLPPTGQPITPAPVTAPQAAPMATAPQPAAQAPASPLGPTPQERALLQQAVQSGDPGQLAWAEETWAGIQMRMADPAASRQKVEMVNGVPYYVDPAGAGAPTPVFSEGVPDLARTRDEFNPQGTRPGTLGQRDPTGRLSIIDEPPIGFEADTASGRLRPIRGGPSDPASGGNQITNERDLRKEFDTLTADYREAAAGLRKVEAAAADQTGASDVALIFGFMKTLDPGSVVREGEFATASNTAGVPDRVVQLYNRVVSGDRLSPDQRVEFASTARNQFATYEEAYQNRVRDFIGMAQQYGLEPSNIVGESQAPASRPRRQPPSGNNGNVLRQRFTPEQAAAELARRRGGQ